MIWPVHKSEIEGSLATSPIAGIRHRTDADDGRGAGYINTAHSTGVSGPKRSAGASCISRADVKAPVTGYLLKRDYKEGSYVNVELPIILVAASSTTKSRHSVPSSPWECLLLNALGVTEVDVLLASCPELLFWGREDAV